MSIDSGGLAAEQLQEKKLKEEEKKPIEDEELEDGELDTDDDDEPVPPPKPAAKEAPKPPQTSGHAAASKSASLASSKPSAAKPDDPKKKLSQSSSSNSNNARKRRRRNNSEDSDDSLDGKRSKRPSSYNSSSSNNRKGNRNKRSNASTDEESGSDDEEPKFDQKMMFSMLKQMKDFFMSNDKSNSKPGNQQEYDKLFERMKNNKSGHKEMMKFFKKNEKMMNSSQDMPALFNSTFNPNMFPNGPNMFTGLQPALAGQQYPPQMNPMLGPPSNFNGPPYSQPPIGPFNPTGLLQPPDTVLQQQYAAAATLNQLARNQAPPPSLNSTSSSSNNKKQKKRKKQKEEKEEFNSDDQQVPKQLCKYFIEGHCQKGNDCDFIHSQPYNYKREICKFYLQDSCGKGNVSFGPSYGRHLSSETVLTFAHPSSPGDNCTFLHKEFPCKLYHTGQDCTLGENCKFSHEPFNEELREIFMNYLDNAELNEELNQAYGLSKNVQKKSILGPVPDDVRASYQTWVWQQEMKKLELAYTGTKRNLFCIDDEFVLKEEPPNDGYEDDEDYSLFNNKDIDERQGSVFFIDTHGELDDEENDSQDSDRRLFGTKDNDYRIMNEELAADAAPSNEPELKSLDEVKKQWLDAESEDDEDPETKNEEEPAKKEEEQPKKSTIDISKMLDAIRQTTTSSTQNSQASSNSSDNNSEFWKAIFSTVKTNDAKSDVDERSLTSQSSSSFAPLKAQSSSSQPVPSQPRDPRLLRQRNKHQSASSVFKIPVDEPFVWSHGDISFRLYRIDVDRIDYSSHRHVYELDVKLKNDPRLQSYFNNLNSTQAAKQNSHGSSSSLPNIINPTDVLAPLTLSESRKKKNAESPAHKLIIPPAPSEKLSAFDLISPSAKQPTSQLSFTEQILASVHLPKSKSLIPDHSGGLSSLADLVTEKSKKVNSADASNVAGV